MVDIRRNSTLLSRVDLDGATDALILDADADTHISAPTDNQIDISVAGADDFTITANVLTVLSGSRIDFDAAAGSYANLLADVNNNELVDTAGIASAVNQLGISNAATGNAPIFEARGGDTNIGINLLAKGTGAIRLNNGTDPVVLQFLGAADGYNNEVYDVNGNELLALQGVASAVAEITISNAATTANPILGTQGETNTGLDVTLAGTGAFRLNNGTDPVVFTFMGAAGGYNNEIQDANGNEILALQGVASAVNELTLTNAATGANVGIGVQGEANVGITVTLAGTGDFRLDNGTDPIIFRLMGAQGGYNNEFHDVNGNELLVFQGVASAVNELGVINAATATSPGLISQGGDTNITMEVSTKGSGWVRVRSGTIGASGNNALLQNLGVVTDTTAGNITYTAASYQEGVVLRDPNGAARSDTSPTAAALVALVPNPQIGDTFEFVIVNTADAAETITLGAGAGITLRGSAGQAFGQNTSKRFLARFTNVTGASEAVDLIAQ